jgi:hypothetical protein
VIYKRGVAPRGKKPSVVLKSRDATPGTISLRQQGLTLVTGETYKLSAYDFYGAKWASQDAIH